MDQKFRLRTGLPKAWQDGIVLIDAARCPSSRQLARALVHEQACRDEEITGWAADLLNGSTAGRCR